MPDQVLVVDDDPTQRRLLEAMVQKFGFSPVVADCGERALEIVEGTVSHLRAIVLDLVMPGMDGMEVMQRLHRRGLRIPIIVQTANGRIETAVMAMRNGAFDFVVKPVSPDRLCEALERAMKVEAFQQQKDRAPRTELSVHELVTSSEAMQRTLNLVRKAAASDVPVIIEGESGVGKELIARAIKGESRRKRKPFVTVNCGAIPDNLVESILFGHEKGAFTGARERHVGKFVEADGGTLFLDEIADLPANIQVKLLRAIQEGEVEPIGARSSVKVDIRLISATNQDLMEEVRQGRFREDLYYRLNVFPIHVPPLRQRKEDIPLVVQHFISRFADAVPGRHISGISDQALAVLARYDWPGNVRELENAVFRAIVLCEGEMLTAAEFPHIQAQVEGGYGSAIVSDNEAISFKPASADRAEQPVLGAEPEHERTGYLRGIDHDGHARTLQAVEQEMILFAIDRYGGQMSEIARRLGIGRSTLYRKLKEMGIDHLAARD